MTAIHHDLAHEFPEFREKIHKLKMDDRHFAKMFDEYHLVNSEVIRLEGEKVPVTDESFEDLKKLRLSLKDKLYNMLNS
ncbi:MAG: YdcH family protein [Methylophilaceae bacterium]